MKVYIDQSGKVEDTAKVTVVAFSNKKNGSLLISAKEKREIQKVFRELGKPKMFTLQVFSTLVYLLIEKFKLEKHLIVIDLEYKGREDLIKSYIIQLGRQRKKVNIDKSDLFFEMVGKSSNAHKLAINKFRVKRAEIKVIKSEVLSCLKVFEQ